MHPIRTRLAVPAALATAAALAFAGAAHAQPNNGGTPAKKGCVIRFEGPGAGQSLEYPDGSSLSVQGTDGKKHTYTCNDGKWTETVAIVAQPGSAISSGRSRSSPASPTSIRRPSPMR